MPPGRSEHLLEISLPRAILRALLRTHFPFKSGKKKEHKPKLLSPDVFRWGGGLPREGVAAKKFGMSLETRVIKLFWRDIPGFCSDIPAVPESLRKKIVCAQFLAPINVKIGVLCSFVWKIAW